MLINDAGGVIPTSRFDIMPFAILKNGSVVARCWTREAGEGAIGWAGTFRGGKIVPIPVAAKIWN
jgi:hypothetical protein